MTRLTTQVLLLATSLWLPMAALAVDAASATPAQTVQFAKGKSSAQLRGVIKGDSDAQYATARAGQTLAVALKWKKKGSLIFNITPKGASEAMFIGSVQGSTTSILLPADGSYVVQVAALDAQCGAARK